MVAKNGKIPMGSSTQIASASKVLPQGKYTLVGIDIDTTGRRLIDEIVQLAAYTPKSHFQQYIMPYMNLNPAARQRHQIRVITIGFYRMLKSMETYKIIKSKSEIAAVKDFLNWLENLKKKDPNSNGVILVCHEERKFIPYMILESLKKYDLLDRFTETVKSFVNSANLSEQIDNGSLANFSLRKLYKNLVPSQTNINTNTTKALQENSRSNHEIKSSRSTNENEVTSSVDDQSQKNEQKLSSFKPPFERDIFDGSASVRAKLVFDVVYHLVNHNEQSDNNLVGIDNMLNAIYQYARPISCDLDELEIQNHILERQNSFRPVFLNYFKTTLYHRVRAVKFRIILAANGYDLQILNGIWTEKRKEGLAECIQAICELKQEDKTELIDLMDSYFDPAKTTIKPVVKLNRRRNRRALPNTKENGTEEPPQHGSGDKHQVLPDSTTRTPPNTKANEPKSQRYRRSTRSRKRPVINNEKSMLLLNNSAIATTA